MKLFRQMAIAPKLMGIVGVLIGGLLVTGFAVVISQATATVSGISQESAEAQADAIAKQLVGELGVADAAVQSMSASLATLHGSGLRSREVAVSVIKPNIMASPLALASWFFEEPLGFDGIPAPGGPGSTPIGAFMPYWIKQDGQIRMEPNTEEGLYSADYYKLSHDSGKASLTEPYPYETGGKTITMTSITYPVVARGRLIGVAGIDVALDDISARLGKMSPFGTGRVMLLSRSGLWVAHPDAATRMKPYGDAGADAVKQALESGEVRHVTVEGADGPIIRVIRPIGMPRLNTTWAVVMDVPAASLSGPAKQLGWQLVVIGLLIMGAVVAGLFFAIRAIVGRPLGALSRAVDGLAKGEKYTIPLLDREDEIGTLARASDVFRQATEDRAIADARSAAEQKQVVASVSDHLEALAGGDLSQGITAAFPPSYAALKSNFNDAVTSLRDLIGSVMDSTDSIRTGSGEIAQASEDLARRTEGNAASLEETSAAIAQIDERLKGTAVSAAQTVERANGAMTTVSDGRGRADDAVQAMERVSESAKGIDSVIGGLDKIAFQTRVLAMNAAVEAGRAGDAGRGFAVVADLVSALAMRAEEEAQRARDQLTATQTDITDAVGAVQKVDLALANISGDVSQVHELLGRMAADNQAQSTAISQISVAIGTMDQSTQQNAAMVEETSAAARNLSVEVGALSDQASRFKVGNGSVHKQRKLANATAYISPVKPLSPRPSAPATQPSGAWHEF